MSIGMPLDLCGRNFRHAHDQGLALLARSLVAGEPNVLAGLLGTADPDRELLDPGTSLVDSVRAVVSRVLGYAWADSVPPDASFDLLGIDSLTLLELRDAFLDATGVRLTIADLAWHRTPNEVAERLREERDAE